jgi:membrane protein
MNFLRLLGRAAKVWFRYDADHHAAALAYFMPFALTPLIIFSITIVGLLYGTERVTAMLVRFGNALDPGVTELLYHSVQNFDQLTTHYYVPILGVVFLSIMIIITFNSLIVGFHKLWSVELSGWKNYLRKLWRIGVFVVVLQVYLVSILLLSDTLALVSSYTGFVVWWALIGYMLTFLLTMLLVATAYGVLSLRSPSFTGRFLGAAVAGLLLLFSRELVAFHFSTAPVQSLFGAAGLLITLLVWIYVAAGVILYGAAFARVYDEATGRTKLSTNE